MSHRKTSVFIDFDKTISPIHGFGVAPNADTINAITTLHQKYLIVIYSCRANTEVCDEADYLEMIKYLEKHKIPYDSICRDKPLYLAIIDDRSYNPARNDKWDDIVSTLMNVII